MSPSRRNESEQVSVEFPQNSETDFPVFFRAVLTPYRSLTKTGTRIVLGIFGGVFTAVSIAFYFMGAWLISLFLLAIPILLGFCFRRNNLDAKVYEEVSVSALEVVVKHVALRRKVCEFRCNPYYARLEKTEDTDVEISQIFLFARGRRVEIGCFLNPADRSSFYRSFSLALLQAVQNNRGYPLN
ncbi:DUF2244 domain-containing protein [Flexibacterium corallicola]|uniref:DUF2244 domain-containing protein n=1 Tax=Flexibacterium corallicola TaxID=3037259 RepID=UPI00286ED62F|nr:DUF2244 domain-containing protein [Pseudovibrio sp. M1P-2-3]